MKGSVDTEIAILFACVTAILTAIICAVAFTIPANETMYSVAVNLYEAGDYKNAISLFEASGIKNSAEYIQSALILIHGGTL